jgi:uncharacterized protein YceK
MKPKKGFLLFSALALAITLLPGCGSRRTYHHANPDGSYAYYRFHRNHTSECSCRNVYQPSSHYYHAHY